MRHGPIGNNYVVAGKRHANQGDTWKIATDANVLLSSAQAHISSGWRGPEQSLTSTGKHMLIHFYASRLRASQKLNQRRLSTIYTSLHFYASADRTCCYALGFTEAMHLVH